MRDFSSALLAKVVELSPGMADVDNTRDDVLEMSSEMFFTVHLLYSGLCTSVDLFGLPQFPDGATYYGERTRKGYAVRLGAGKGPVGSPAFVAALMKDTAVIR